MVNEIKARVEDITQCRQAWISNFTLG